MSTEDFKQMVTPCDDPFPVNSDTQPTPDPTPRTDAERHKTHACYDAVTADFARTLERELAAKDAEIARRKAQLDMWTSAAMDGNAAIAQLTARAEKAEAELEGMKEALRVAQKDRDDHLGGIKRLHELYGEPYYSWQRVYQNTERLLAERDQLRAEVERLNRPDSDDPHSSTVFNLHRSKQGLS